MEIFFDFMVIAIGLLGILALLFVLLAGYFHQKQKKQEAEKAAILDRIKTPLYHYYLFGKELPENITFDSQLKIETYLQLNERLINNFQQESLESRMAHLTQKVAGEHIYQLLRSHSQDKQNQGLDLIRKFQLTELYNRLKREGYLERKNLPLAQRLLLISFFESQHFVDEFLAQASLISVPEKSFLLENISAKAFTNLLESFNCLTKTNKIILIKATGNRIDSPPLSFLVQVIQEEDLDMKYHALKALDKYISLENLTEILDSHYLIWVKSKDRFPTKETIMELKGEN